MAQSSSKNYSVLIDGINADTISVFDRGLQYGDGLFETVAVVKACIPLWSSHYKRLKRGCECLGIPCPKAGELMAEINSLLTTKKKARAVIKIIITRGNSYGGYRISENEKAHTIIILRPWPQYPEPWHRTGVTIRTSTIREAFQPALAGMKHLNRLESVLARQEWQTTAIQEGILCDQEGYVVEGTMSNFFMIKQGVLHTPLIDRCGVDGVMRQFVIALASKLGYAVKERRIALEECQRSDEIFLTNAIFGIWPVQSWPDVVTLNDWPLTAALQLSLKEQLGLWDDL